MGGTGLARVEQSNDPAFDIGSLVTAATGWQDYSVHDGRTVTPVDAEHADPAMSLGILGTNGLTAYFGLLDLGRPQAGDTVLVSAAAGSVGHVVGQIAKIKGARVVGVAGSDEKLRMLTDQLGFDAAVNYKDPEFRNAFRAATPDRIALSDRICAGLQVTEHIQDVAEDYTRGRVYLPREDLARFGCAEFLGTPS